MSFLVEVRFQMSIMGSCKKKVTSTVVEPVEVVYEDWEIILGYEVDD
jgi:hypothetical protein